VDEPVTVVWSLASESESLAVMSSSKKPESWCKHNDHGADEHVVDPMNNAGSLLQAIATSGHKNRFEDSSEIK
jgi:hypothetical protein